MKGRKRPRSQTPKQWHRSAGPGPRESRLRPRSDQLPPTPLSAAGVPSRTRPGVPTATWRVGSRDGGSGREVARGTPVFAAASRGHDYLRACPGARRQRHDPVGALDARSAPGDRGALGGATVVVPTRPSCAALSKWPPAPQRAPPRMRPGAREVSMLTGDAGCADARNPAAPESGPVTPLSAARRAGVRARALRGPEPGRAGGSAPSPPEGQGHCTSDSTERRSRGPGGPEAASEARSFKAAVYLAPTVCNTPRDAPALRD